MLPSFVRHQHFPSHIFISPPYSVPIQCIITEKPLKMPHFSKAGSRNMAENCAIDFSFLSLYGTMASAEREPITGVWGRSPQRVQGQSPWSGQGAKPSEQAVVTFLYSKCIFCSALFLWHLNFALVQKGETKRRVLPVGRWAEATARRRPDAGLRPASGRATGFAAGRATMQPGTLE